MKVEEMFARRDNPHRLYRDTERGMLAGVCAGIAHYFGIRPSYVRLTAILGLILFFVPTALAYLALALTLRPKPPKLYQSTDEEEFWRGVSTAPNQALQSLQHRFRVLDQRLARMESLVTSNELELRRKFRDIGA